MFRFVSFEVTIVVDSVCFSWDLSPHNSCVSFFFYFVVAAKEAKLK